jgi:hypothetical protein
MIFWYRNHIVCANFLKSTGTYFEAERDVAGTCDAEPAVGVDICRSRYLPYLDIVR